MNLCPECLEENPDPELHGSYWLEEVGIGPKFIICQTPSEEIARRKLEAYKQSKGSMAAKSGPVVWSKPPDSGDIKIRSIVFCPLS